jgi:hypothetical protein
MSPLTVALQTSIVRSIAVTDRARGLMTSRRRSTQRRLRRRIRERLRNLAQMSSRQYQKVQESLVPRLLDRKIELAWNL